MHGDALARSSDEVQFNHPSRTANADLSVPLGGMPRALREAAEMGGLDPVAQLFNEATNYAAEGHLRLAKERLQMLLCMAPDDTEARLLLAKVHVAGQRWQEALSALDEARDVGAQVPSALRNAVEEHLRQENASLDAQRTAGRAREQGEIKALRQEARRLRSENAQMVARSAELEAETRRWAWTTAGVSATAIVFIVANLLFGGSPASEEAIVAEAAAGTTTEEVAEAGVAEDAVIEAAPTAAPSSQSVAAKAAEVLSTAAGLEGASLEVAVHNGSATVSGEVQTFRQRKNAEKALTAVSGIETVSMDKVTVLARTKGTVHTVQSGDTLSHIAYEYYGESSKTKPISRANKAGKMLSIGQKLVIPPIE